MQKNVLEYTRYSFSKLFSKYFWNIVGSSLIVSLVYTLLAIGVIWGAIVLLSEPVMSGYSDTARSLIILFGLLTLVSLSILVHGWLAIVIPVRSIDDTRHMDFRGDYTLWKEYISIYSWYLFWYSLIFLGIVIVSPLILIIATAVHMILGWIVALSSIIVILYILTRLYLTWYHMLSEWSGSQKTLRKSITLSRKRVWKIWSLVLLYSLIILTLGIAIEAAMFTLMDLLGSGDLLYRILWTLRENQEDLTVMLQNIETVLGEDLIVTFSSFLVFGIFFSVSSTLSRALYHIFYVRYYLDIREEHENENSFVKSILYGSSHR